MSTSSATIARVPYSPIRPDFAELAELMRLASTSTIAFALAPYGSNLDHRARGVEADKRRFNEALQAVIDSGELADFSAYAAWAKATREAAPIG